MTDIELLAHLNHIATAINRVADAIEDDNRLRQQTANDLSELIEERTGLTRQQRIRHLKQLGGDE